jgi:amidophosphoribosyltransferase
MPDRAGCSLSSRNDPAAAVHTAADAHARPPAPALPAGDFTDDHPREECGVFGLYAPGHDASRLSFYALFALQHRGQESAGIAAADRRGHIITRRELGLVSQVFSENDLRTLAGELAIGHVRYSTTGSNAWENSQPVHRSQGTNGSRREVALAHNGNLINAVELHEELLAKGVTFGATSDSEIIAALIATHPAERLEDAIAAVLPRLRGAFSIVAMTRDRVVAFRDPHGVRPLSIGVLAPVGSPPWHGGHDRAGSPGVDAPAAPDEQLRYCVASETCAFDIIGATHLRDVEPGEIVTLDERGLTSRRDATDERKAFCVFEYIYFARPDSRMNGQALQVARGRMGEILWREAPVDADVVIAVPDSGNAAARGVARASGLPQDDGFVKNRYVARTFIEPGQELRKHGLRLKFNPLPEVIAGQRLVVVDDSIVRGNTTRQIVKMLREAGAKEVHLRISAPPIKNPCHYGIDMSTREEMIAHENTVQQIAAQLGCDSLHYLSMAGVYEAVGVEPSTHCDACFTGHYPLHGSATANGKYALEPDESVVDVQRQSSRAAVASL